MTTQREHWSSAFAEHPDMYGTEPSEPAIAAVQAFAADGARTVLELGAGQGRDTLFLADRGFAVTAFDFALDGLQAITDKADAAGVADRVRTEPGDVRERLPFTDASFDASYSHMLFCMALTTAELERLASELRRVLRPGGLVVYTVRHVGDAHYGVGAAQGDDTFENGGFIVHFFDDALVERLSAGYDLLDVSELTEGDLPRRLWRVTMRAGGGDLP